MIVSQQETPGQWRIRGTERETAAIQYIFLQTTKYLNHEKGTVAVVVEGMKTHSWVHLACHDI
jgi:CHAT domain-containing protein